MITPAQIETTDLTVEFLAVFPLHPAELETARRMGADALLDGLDDAEASELLLRDRASVV